jgi:hypothetical protein
MTTIRLSVFGDSIEVVAGDMYTLAVTTALRISAETE